MEIDEIVTRAIPAETCPVKNANAMHRREELKRRIEQLLRDKTKPFEPRTEYKGSDGMDGDRIRREPVRSLPISY